MIRDQLSLFESQTQINNKLITDKPVDLSTVVDKDKPIVKNKYFIYPTGGKHPYANFDKKLNSQDYPFIVNRDYRNKGREKILEITNRKGVIYPYIGLELLNPQKRHGNSALICIHKLIARAFIDPGELDPYDSNTVVDHIDGKPWNYRISNLRFVTRSQNAMGCKKISKKDIFEVAKKEGRF
tara:strand:+ start:228 stop:776 length:549 start_codon:yes stop_codon:yes gene_type:complete